MAELESDGCATAQKNLVEVSLDNGIFRSLIVSLTLVSRFDSVATTKCMVGTGIDAMLEKTSERIESRVEQNIGTRSIVGRNSH